MITTQSPALPPLMEDQAPPLVKPAADDAADRSLLDDVQQLITDGRTLLEAELAYQKSRAAVAGQGAKSVAAWGGLAVVLVCFALMALTFGLVLGLASVIGPWLATLVTVVALLIAAALCGAAAARRWKHVAGQLSQPDETP
ncbi:hypothetical protein GCM10011617_13710 [Novosphingobium arvoryzae]|uniref:Holin-X, holin superfamily III n=2 Tax=Novosphingobium arvoryzae TaxID=1256514 RepID=A0A918VFZ7_9SPHN|nr:hypothetical protein GCM10011617_13710 [Novosphingobium arvoryzae]